MPSLMEHKYTSTGRKFWLHPEAMRAYREGTGRTVISTHIAPEGACNLKCPYCSVTHRDTHSRIDMDTIRDYVQKLKARGLCAVILTGGGEPTAYPHFNDLVGWLDDLGLRVALITNGTLGHKVSDESWRVFDWVRISVNFFDRWRERIAIPREKVRDDCVVGLSTVFTDRHEDPDELRLGWRALYEDVKLLADKMDADYVRVLPNCLLPQPKLLERHRQLDAVLAEVQDGRFFHQHKVHGAPDSDVCHQSYFRPYLSEEPNPWDGKPGTVFPCDSVVLNAPARGSEGYGKFMAKYALCRPHEVGDYMDLKIRAGFVPRKDCEGCVFTRNVEMLGRWLEDGIDRHEPGPTDHAAFV